MQETSESKNKASKDDSTGVGVVLLFFGLLSLACLIQMRDGLESLSWPSTEGKVKSCNLVRKGGGRLVSIWYDFQVQGKKYSSNKYWFAEQYESLMTKHNPPLPHAGALVPVYYCPAQPNKAVLERGVPLYAFGMAGFSWAMTLLCSIALTGLPKMLKRTILWGLFVLALASLFLPFLCTLTTGNLELRWRCLSLMIQFQRLGGLHKSLIFRSSVTRRTADNS